MGITENKGKFFINDFIRNKKVRLTPEEWVRQHLLHFLVLNLNYPKGLIKIESNVKFNQLQQRADLIVYKPDGTVFLIAECKRPTVNITSDTLYQAVRYNSKLDAQFVLITNGNDHHCFSMKSKNGKLKVLDAFPEYGQIED